MSFGSNTSRSTVGGECGCSHRRPNLLERLWEAPRVWRTVAIVSVVVALLGAGAGGAAAATALTTTQIGYSSSSGTKVAHVNGGSLQVSGSVKVSNPTAAPATDVILDADLAPASATSEYTPMPTTDVHQYGSVTVYIYAWTNSLQECSAQSLDPDDDEIPVGSKNSSAGAGEQLLIWTFDPAPPNLEVYCYNSSSSSMQYDVMVTGRTG